MGHVMCAVCVQARTNPNNLPNQGAVHWQAIPTPNETCCAHREIPSVWQLLTFLQFKIRYLVDACSRVAEREPVQLQVCNPSGSREPFCVCTSHAICVLRRCATHTDEVHDAILLGNPLVHPAASITAEISTAQLPHLIAFAIGAQRSVVVRRTYIGQRY
jgi:hypothetical protein